MSIDTKASTTAAALKQQYKDAGIDYTGLAEFSDVSGYKDGTNSYTLKAHKPIDVTCTNLKPNTRVWPRFDGRDVSNYSKPEGGSYGNALITDSSGNLTFYFKIPNDSVMKFKGFKHLLEVSDVKPPAGNGISSGKVGATTRCGQYYYSPSNKAGWSARDVKQTSGISLSELAADGTKVLVTTTQVEEEVPDYLSQAFIVQSGSINDGVFLKNVKLYFKKKPSSSLSSVLIQVRTTGKDGKPTDVLLGQSASINSNSVNTSATAAQSTTFTFDDNIFLKNGERYAITVIPTEDSTDFELWTARANQADIANDRQAFFSKDIGALYGSATGKVWSNLPNESLKMELSYATFSTTVTSEFVFENDDLEFLNISDLSPSGQPTFNTGFQIDETVIGESVLGIDYSGGTAPTLGTLVQNVVAKNGASPFVTGYAQGTIRSIVNDDTVNDILTVKIDSCGTFVAEANVYNSSGTKIGSANTFTANTVSGTVSFVNTDFGRLRLTDSTATPVADAKFTAGEYVRGQTFGASAKVDGVVNPKIDSVDIRTPFISGHGTSIDWYVKATSTAGAVDTSWSKITGATEVEFDKEMKRIYSRSNKTGSTLLIKGEMTTTDDKVSPVVNIDEINVVASRERLSSNATNETIPAGDAEARYISKPMRATSKTSSDPSERINIVTSAYYPNESGIYLYVRAKNDNDSEPLADKNYTQMTIYDSYPKERSTLGDRGDKILLSHRISANTNGDNFLGTSNLLRENTSNNGVISYRSGDGSIHHGIDEYQIKVVYTKPETRGTSYSPEIDNLAVEAHKAPLPIT
jgi:hypothetical protein